MNSEQLTSFNLHLAKQCRTLSKLTNHDYKKFKMTYSKSNSSTSSYLNSEFDDLDELDDENSDENSNDTCQSNLSFFDSKFGNHDTIKSVLPKGVLNESNLYRFKIETRQRTNQSGLKRKAANLRERRRMKSINCAFDVSIFFFF